MVESENNKGKVLWYSAVPDLGTRYFHNFKLKELILYSRQKPSALQPKKYKLKQESLVSIKNFMCQSSSSKRNENPAIEALSKKTKIFRVLILLAGSI